MSITYTHPLLPKHYRILLDPPDDRGDEALSFVSESRRIKLKGRSFREFHRSVIPLLDGSHTVDEISEVVSDLFGREELEEALALLAGHNLLREGEGTYRPGAHVTARREPQLNLFHDLGIEPAHLQECLRSATVSILGAGGMGAATAMSLSAAGVGTLKLFDSLPVQLTDTYLAPFLRQDDVGRSRVEVVCRHVERSTEGGVCIPVSDTLTTDAEIKQAIAGSHYLICCLDAGQSGLIYKLNRACLELRIPWISGATSGKDLIVGPAIQPYETACYMCYKMRIVSCAENPHDQFALESHLDRRANDDSAHREAIVFGSMLLGNLLGWEAVKALVGVNACPAVGNITVFDLLTLSSTRHKVLRKPWCPACHVEEKAG
jgi:bacteriocin biosynthesis cyclodehydratase domain-containing protein